MAEIRRWPEQEQGADILTRQNRQSAHPRPGASRAPRAKVGLAATIGQNRTLSRTKRRTTAGRTASVRSDNAERRQLTIMFCDMVGSVSLSTKLDPEDLRDLITAYQGACTRSVALYGGYVARYVGDGLLIYFGYPVAHEDDAERAVRAGLELLSGISRLNESLQGVIDSELKVRIGVATGTVVVGDIVAAEGNSDKSAVVGEAANLAARLQAIASPNTIIVSATTRELAGNRFEYGNLGLQQLKGFAEPVPAFEILGVNEITRLAARREALTRFAGRQDEVAALIKSWEDAGGGSGRVVAICGEAGIGKSRIVAEAITRIRRRGHADLEPLELQFSPFHSKSTLLPTIRQIERVAGILASDPASTKVDKLLNVQHQATDISERQRNVAVMADLLGLAPDERYLLRDFSPTVKRNLAVEVLVQWYAGFVKEYPVVIIFEDVQWIDPSSKLLLRRLARWATTAKALIVLTLRTDAATDTDKLLMDCGLVISGEDKSAITRCDVQELNPTYAKQLAKSAAMSEGRVLDDSQLDAVLSRSEGVPLYLEELVKARLKGIEFPQSKQKRVQAGMIPATISDAMMEQLDQLGPTKKVVQYASVIGYEFSQNLLAQILNTTEEHLSAALERLIDAKVISRDASFAYHYRFRHALIRDISYHSLLRKNRQQIHLAVAKELSTRGIEFGVITADLIAQHYALGNAAMEAIRFWLRGANDAIARSAHEEALAMLEAASSELRKLNTDAAPVTELEIVLAQAMVLRSLRGYAAAEVEERLIRARELCAQCADVRNSFNVEWGLFQCAIVKSDIEGARELAEGLLSHAERHPDQPLADAHLARGMAAFGAGDFAAAAAFLERGVSLSRPETDEPHFMTHGQNAGVFCLSYLARTLCFLGYVDRGRQIIDRVLAIATARSADPGHIYGRVNALIHAVRVYHLCGDLEAEKRLAREAYALSQRNHFAYYEGASACHLGWVAGAEGCVSEGIDQMGAGIAALQMTGTSSTVRGFHILLAQLYVDANRFDDAERILQLAEGSKGFAVWAAEVERVRGDIAVSRSPPDWIAAEAAYRSSLAIAEEQRAGLLVCRTGWRLIRLLQQLNRRREGYELLKECLQRMPEGEDLPLVKNMRMEIEELAE